VTVPALPPEVTLRTVVPADLELEREFTMGLSAKSRYFRWLGTAAYPLSNEQLRRLTQPVPGREYAVAAVYRAHGSEHIAGVARYAMNAPDSAEFAVSVADAWQRRGIGRHLLQNVIDHARAQGIRTLHGDIMGSNHASLALARRLGFVISTHADGSTLRLARLDLQAERSTGSSEQRPN